MQTRKAMITGPAKGISDNSLSKMKMPNAKNDKLFRFTYGYQVCSQASRKCALTAASQNYKCFHKS
jgi:hypothetical protein